MRLRVNAVQIARQDGAARLHLPHRKLVLRMAGEGGIEQPRHPRFEETGYLQRIVALPHHAPIKRLQPRQHHPGVESGQRRSGVAGRSEEHTSELQSLMRILYAAYCSKTETNTQLVVTIR